MQLMQGETMVISAGDKGISEIFQLLVIFHSVVTQRDLMNNSTCSFVVSFIIINVDALYN